LTAVAIALSCVVGLLSVIPIGILWGRRKAASTLVYSLCMVISVVGLINALDALLQSAPASRLVLPLGLPWLGGHFRLDVVSAFFLSVIHLGAAAASLYGIGYGRHEQAPHRVLPFFPAFLAGMSLVVLADDAFAFLLSWEFMSLASWALVMTHHQIHDNARAGFIYLLMASFGTLSLLLAFGLMAGEDGTYAFDAIRAAQHGPLIVALAMGLGLLGCGSKAGLVPLHVWLPLAHPAAPSHVSALMSGVMTKVAIYGFVRIAFDLLGPSTWWTSMVVLFLGGVTATMGVLYALMQNDLKRMLAYSSVENIGIVFIGLGLALAFRANNMGFAAALALTAALFHLLNHSLFKSLLFFGAGAVLSATGLRDMEQLGGLIHPMPKTSLAFLVGSIAISALPPLNGFVSEWLTFQAVLLSPGLPQWGLKVLIPAVGCLLALAAVLAAACFVKAFGITFLGRARSEKAALATEVDPISVAAMFMLAILCLAAGIFPGLVIDALAPVSTVLIGVHMPEQTSIPWLSIVPIAASRSSYNGLLVFIFMLSSSSLAALVIHRLASKISRRSPAWDCGHPDSNPANQYTAGSFSQPLRRVFGSMVFMAREKVHMPPPGDPRPATIHLRMIDPVWNLIYARLVRAVDALAGRFNHFQTLTIRGYLSLVFLSLITLLTGLAIWL